MSEEKIINEELYQKFFNIVGSPDEGKRISQARAARELGLSSGVISAYKNRNYNGNITTIEEKIQAFLKREERRGSKLVIPVVETTTIQNMYTAIEMAHDYKNIAVIVGDSGLGKTTGARQYALENPAAAMVVYACQDMPQRQFIEDIATGIGLSTKGGKGQLLKSIVSELRGRDMVLIIDQADYLSDRSLEMLRCITVDMAGIGLVLVGLPQLEDRIKRLTDHAQLLSRVGTLCKVRKMKPADIALIVCEIWAQLDKETIDAFVKEADGSGRRLEMLIKGTNHIMATYREEIPNADMVSSASELVMRQDEYDERTRIKPRGKL